MRITRRQLDTMNQDEVLELVMREPKFQKHIRDKKITRVHFQSEIGCGANISIGTKKNIVEKAKEEAV